MNLQAIIVTNSMGVLILAVLMISSSLVRQRRLLSDRVFTVMCILTALSCVADTIGFLCNEKTDKASVATAFIMDTFTYVTNIVVCILWCLYVDLRLYASNRHVISTLKKICLPGAIGLVGLLINPFTGLVFVIDAEGVYQRSTAAPYYFMLTYFYLFASVFIRRSHKKKMGMTKFVPVWMFLIPILICAVIQMFVYGISLTWCSVAIGLVSMHMSLQNELMYLDPLTRLYNRNYLNHTINQYRNSKLNILGIMLDMDGFKQINDTYGHSEGDEALVEMSRLLERAVPGKAIPIRYAGDEFMILIPGDSRNELDEVVNAVRREEREFNESGKKPYKLSFSLGTSTFAGDSDPDAFLKEMDKNMYLEKKQKHGEVNIELRDIY